MRLSSTFLGAPWRLALRPTTIAGVGGLALAAVIVGLSPALELPSAALSSDWTQYSYDLTGSDYNSGETTLTTTTVPKLKLQWTDAGSTGASAQPIVLNGVVYWGDWGGVLHATPVDGANAGKDVWHTSLGVTTDSHCNPAVAGIASTPAVGAVNGVTTLYLAGGGNDATGANAIYLYAINANTGAVTWKTQIDVDTLTAGGFGWSSPMVYNGSVYIGTSSLGDCPLQRGRMIQIDATTGAIQHSFYTVPTGCIAGGIWGSPTVDTSTGMLFVNTGTPSPVSTTMTCQGAPTDYSMSVLELRASDLSYVDHWRVPPAQAVTDGDFGDVPTLFTATINGVSTPMVGTGNKNGLWYAFRRSALGAGPVWQLRVTNSNGNPRKQGSISPAVWDGHTLYVGSGALSSAGATCLGSVHALDPATGAVKWLQCNSDGDFVGSLVATPGVLYGTTGFGASVLAMSMTNGATLFRYKEPSGQPYWSPPTPAEGHLFAVNMDGKLTSFSLPGSPTPTPGSPSPSSSPTVAPTPTMPGAATNLTAVGGAGQANVSWTAPANTGNGTINYYTIYAFSYTGTPKELVVSGTSATVTGLTPGSWTFTVTAWNGFYWGAWSGWSNWATVA